MRAGPSASFLTGPLNLKLEIGCQDDLEGFESRKFAKWTA